MDGSTYVDMDDDAKPFAPGSKKAVELLESILPAEKAQAVPYVRIWEINPDTGRPHHESAPGVPRSPLSLTTVDPPRFGQSVGENRFPERPPVSLERVVVKTDNPRGLISYRTIDLSFVVHKPQVIFDDHLILDDKGGVKHQGDQDSWTSLITPGQMFCMEYGWSASKSVQNAIINGYSYSDQRSGVLIPGRERINFVVVNYDFKIMNNSEIKFDISCFESGQAGLRQTFLSNPEERTVDGFSKKNVKDGTYHLLDPVNPYGMLPDGSIYLDPFIRKVLDRLPEKATIDRVKGGKVIKFGDVFDIMFGDLIKKSYAAAGYSEVKIFMGRFNTRAGSPVEKFSGGASLNNTPISEFTFPLEFVQDSFNKLTSAGKSLTVYNYVTAFFEIFRNPTTWTKQGESNADQITPEVIMRATSYSSDDPNSTSTENGSSKIFFYIFDVNREYTRTNSKSDNKLRIADRTREGIKKAVEDKNIPFVSLLRANSYIVEPSFQVIQDEAMKSIAITNTFRPKTREEYVTLPDIVKKKNRIPLAQQIFSRSIQGNITMLGNFVFDIYNMIWVDFGITLWDGLFFIAGREDVIERGSFTTNIKLYSAGINPFVSPESLDSVQLADQNNRLV